MMYLNNFVAVVKSKGKILREREPGTTYLPFGSEYSLLLKNNNCKKALVDIEVDGIKVLKGKLIMEPNSSTEIKGFMRDTHNTNAFRFIKKTDEISNFRGDRIEDGSIRIEYQFESDVFFTYRSTPVWDCWGSSTINCNNTTSCYSSSKLLTSNIITNNFVEDGITVKGKDLIQDYTYGSIGPLEINKNVIMLYLKGYSTKGNNINKPITVKTKIQCPTCGRKNRSSNKFCYNCGTNLG